MYEINVAGLETDSAEFPIAMEALRNRHNRFYRLHVPDGPLTYMRSAPEPQAVAGSYTPVIVNHAQTVSGAFEHQLYASGLALVRPLMEALLKQCMLMSYEGDDDEWKAIPNKRIRVNKSALRDLAARSGCPDLGPVWENNSKTFSDFVHGGTGMLASNPIDEHGWPKYPGAWIWSSMLFASVAVLTTSGFFWAHLGHEERCQGIRQTFANENWGGLTIMRNGQNIRIVARRGN